MTKNYTLPDLGYGYSDLAPAMSADQLKIHHAKHHNAYVTGLNALLEKFDTAAGGGGLDAKAFAKAFAFQIGGHYLHSLFWQNLAPAKNGGGGEPKEALSEAINAGFGGFENFKKIFTEIAMGVEGSGWAMLAQCRETGRLLPAQIEKHNVNAYAGFTPVLVLDMFEHAYYLDYKNEKAKYIEAFWTIVNWPEAAKRLNK